MNRITAAIDKIQTMIDEGGKDGALDTPEKRAAFEAVQDVVPWESAKYRDINAVACLRGILTLDEGNIVYHALGREGFPSGNGGWALGVTLAEKVAITALMGQLLDLDREMTA